jgi:hypothetical protein
VVRPEEGQLKNLGFIGRLLAGAFLAASVHLTIVGFFLVSNHPFFGGIAMMDLGLSILIARLVNPGASDFVLSGLFWASLLWAAIGALLISGIKRWRNIGLALVAINFVVGLVTLFWFGD